MGEIDIVKAAEEPEGGITGTLELKFEGDVMVTMEIKGPSYLAAARTLRHVGQESFLMNWLEAVTSEEGWNDVKDPDL